MTQWLVACDEHSPLPGSLIDAQKFKAITILGSLPVVVSETQSVCSYVTVYPRYLYPELRGVLLEPEGGQG